MAIPPLTSPFGCNPPTGDRGDERAFSANRFELDLMGALDFVTRYFDSRAKPWSGRSRRSRASRIRTTSSCSWTR
jgi:hypothetical protein